MELFQDSAFFDLLAGSYLRLAGVKLVPPEIEDPIAWLYGEAPFCVLAHDTAADPRFIYGNRAAQALFEYSWAELTALPSRLSAEAPNREERQSLLDRVSRHGIAFGYAGIRISRTGRRFWIEEGTVWQLIDEVGVVHGQAARFDKWRAV
jgi:MEKHLA domain